MSILKNYGCAILRLPEGEGGAGGGGAAADDAKPLTAAEIQTLVGNTVNSAVTAQLKRAIGPGIAEALKAVPWGDVLKPEFEKFKPAEPVVAPAGGGAKTPDPEMSALRGQMADLQTRYQASETARVAAETKAKEERAYTELRTALAPHVRPEALDIAAKNLFLAEKRVTVDENGNALLTVRRAPFQGAAEEDLPLPLADGVKHWIGTSEGKFFAPPPSGGAQGQRGAAGGIPRHAATGRDGMPTYEGPATTDAEKVHRAGERAAALAVKYPHL